MHVRQDQEGKNDDKKDSQDVHPFFRGGGYMDFDCNMLYVVSLCAVGIVVFESGRILV